MAVIELVDKIANAVERNEPILGLVKSLWHDKKSRYFVVQIRIILRF